MTAHRAAIHARGRASDRGPLLLVGAAILFGLVVLWPETTDVWYLNDSAVHRSMVGWAAFRRCRAGTTRSMAGAVTAPR